MSDLAPQRFSELLHRHEPELLLLVLGGVAIRLVVVVPSAPQLFRGVRTSSIPRLVFARQKEGALGQLRQQPRQVLRDVLLESIVLQNALAPVSVFIHVLPVVVAAPVVRRPTAAHTAEATRAAVDGE